jgi:hypothetical protein
MTKFAEIYYWIFWLIQSGSADITVFGSNPDPELVATRYLCDVTPELLVGEEGLGTVRAHQPVRQLVVVQELHVLLGGGKNGGNVK